ncbi:MAG: RMD1 family protein [Parachlamydiaceae bacterium]|nr:RMD1 family protein [Parachlamydiaceae bacterium]
MDCLSFCTATSYQIKPLFESLRHRYKATLYRDVVHIEVPLKGRNGDVFYFSYGSVVCWNMSREVALPFLEEVRPFETQRYDEIETDEFTYIYDGGPRVADDEIVLPSQDALTKLAISHGLAQSVKLGSFEVATQKTFNNMQYIPEELAKRGTIRLSRREIRRKMGELFLERNSISLHVNVLDTPEFFWDYPELEPLYRMIANYLDIEKRSHVLNQRLQVIHELFEMLGSELNHQHSSRLEWIIIGLIVIEVVVSLLHDVFRIL